MKADLTLLYSELGLAPNCSLAELQLAYRRRISELQPNRQAEGLQSPESTAALCDLIGLYTTASRFHRRYGRLPGATPHRSRAGEALHVGIGRPRYSAYPSDHRSPPTSRMALGVVVILLVLLFSLIALASGEWLR